MRAEIRELRNGFQQVKDELAASRRESAELRRELQTVKEQMARAPETKEGKERLASLEEQQALTAAKVDDHYQTKVASASKYRVRLSGMALFTGSTARGGIDQLDVPTMPEPLGPGERGVSVAGSLRQSQIGLELFGPEWLGAKIHGGVQFDFSGGFPASPEGLTAGLARMRTARLALEWKNTSIVAEQEAPFFSSLSPSSLVSAAYPSFSNSGNLWTWTPQVYVEHRIQSSERTQFSLRGGVLDPLTGELPASEYERLATAGERGRRPAFAGRAGWQRAYGDRRASAGAGFYIAHQDWNFNRTVEAWAVTGDWDLPLGRRFAWSGELYRGTSMGGLGGSANASVLLTPMLVIPLDSTGGWSQLKFQPVDKWQFNGAFGQDVTSGDRLQRAATEFVRRNAAGTFNFIYQARSNFLLSAEYRHLWMRRSSGGMLTADYVSLGVGILF